MVIGGRWWTVYLFLSTPVLRCPYTPATRGKTSLRSELKKIETSPNLVKLNKNVLLNLIDKLNIPHYTVQPMSGYSNPENEVGTK